jgi:hypothetical protein
MASSGLIKGHENPASTQNSKGAEIFFMTPRSFDMQFHFLIIRSITGDTGDASRCYHLNSDLRINRLSNLCVSQSVISI